MDCGPALTLDDLQIADWTGRGMLHVGHDGAALCQAARQAGARSAASIQLTPQPGRDEARPRDPAPALLKALAGLPPVPLDVIVLAWTGQPARLSSALLQAALDRLGERGILFVDLFGAVEQEWAWARRETDGAMWEAPTRLLFERELFRDTAFRVLREQPGPFPNWRRYLVRLQHWRQDVILTAGAPQSGKTSLIRTLSAQGLATYSLDQFLQRVATGAVSDDSAFGPFVRERFVSARIHELVEAIAQPEVAQGCADLLARILPREPRLLVMEGYLLSNDLVFEAVRASLRRQGRRCWGLARLGGAD